MMETNRLKKKKGMNTANNLHLPWDCIMEILMRLPVRSLIRFKCVSKTWFSLISDYKFAKSHFELSARPSHRFICDGGDVVITVDPDVLFQDDPLTLNLVPPTIAATDAGMCSCRGLLLLNDFPDFKLWNPSTGAHKCIPPAPPSPINRYMYGFGYDASKDDYMIFFAYLPHKGHFYIFSVRANSWTKFEDTSSSPFIDIGIFNTVGSFLNGALHWDAGSHYILSFDLIERRFGLINLPKVNINSNFYVLGGYLAVLYVTYINVDLKVEVWIMEEYKVQSSWIRRYKFDRDGLIEPIHLDKCGDIIGFGDIFSIGKYNNKGELIDHRRRPNYLLYDTILHAESIMPFPSGGRDEGDVKQQ